MTIKSVTANQVTELQQITGEGRMWCHKQLHNHICLQHINNATTFGELKEALLELFPKSDPSVVQVLGEIKK